MAKGCKKGWRPLLRKMANEIHPVIAEFIRTVLAPLIAERVLEELRAEKKERSDESSEEG